MKYKNLFPSLILVGLAGLAAPVHSATVTYAFDSLLFGHPAYPSGDFATLKVNSGAQTEDPWTFRLDAYDLNSFGPWAFFGSLAVAGEVNGAPKILSTTAGSGIREVSLLPGNGPGGAVDLRFDLSGWKKGRLTSGEWVEWTMTGLSSITGLGGHIQGIGILGFHSAWYGADRLPSPVPLPATFWLAISTILGFLGLKRRRALKVAWSKRALSWDKSNSSLA
ncbi:MAG: hypothetical protein ACTHWH_01210 [Marinobacter sp.]